MVAQDGVTPVLVSAPVAGAGSSDPVPTQISFDPDSAPPIPELFGGSDSPIPELFGGASDGGDADIFGDLGGLLTGLFGGGGTNTAGDGDGQDMLGDLGDLISGIFGGGDDSDPDGQGSNIVEELLGAGLGMGSTSGPFNLECPSSCEKPELCQGDIMSLMSMDTLQQMCDSGCIPTIVLNACDSNAVTVDGTIGFITSTGVCDFVNCCIATETGDAAVISSTRTKFDECQEKLPEMADLLGSTTFPQDSSATTTTTSDVGGPSDMDFDMSSIQDLIEEVVDGFDEVLETFGDGLLSDMFSDMFTSSSIPAFCAVGTCTDAPPGFCECFSGDLAQCNTDVISQACTSDAFSTCAPEGFTEFCSNECGQSSGPDILHMCAMCNVVTCCSKDNSEMEGCLSEALEDHSQVITNDVDTIFSGLEDFLGGMDLEGMLAEVLGDMESMKFCPDDKTCAEPLGQQFCDIANGGPSAMNSDTAISPRMGLQSFDLGNIGMDLDAMCRNDMLLGCGPVDMKAKCDSVCAEGSGNDGIMKEAFCHLCGLATCCEDGDKSFSECSSASYVSTDNPVAPDQDSTPEPPAEEAEVTNDTNAASDGSQEADLIEASPEEATTEATAEEATEPQAQASQITSLENSRFEQENSGMTFSSISFFTAVVSTGLVLALY